MIKMNINDFFRFLAISNEMDKTTKAILDTIGERHYCEDFSYEYIGDDNINIAYTNSYSGCGSGCGSVSANITVPICLFTQDDEFMKTKAIVKWDNKRSEELEIENKRKSEEKEKQDKAYRKRQFLKLKAEFEAK